MIFAKALSGTLHNIESILKKFLKASGLEINLLKSKFFSKSVPDALRRNSKLKIGYLPIRHLGISLRHKKLQTVHYQLVVDISPSTRYLRLVGLRC